MSKEDTVEALRARLPANALELLDGKDGRYSEWATASSLAMSALNAGLSEEEYVCVVAASDFADEFATENGRDRSDRLDSRLRKVWDKAEEDWEPPLGGISEVRKKLSQLMKLAEFHDWTGRSGSTDRAVCLSVLSYGHEVGAWSLNLSTRFLADRVGVGHSTVSRSLKRLTVTGLLRNEGSSGSPGAATCWSINLNWSPPSKLNTGTHNPSYGGRGLYVPLCNSTHDAFTRGALGLTAGRIWFSLPEEEALTVREVAQRLGVTQATARRNLDLLASVELVSKSQSKPYRYRVAQVSTEQLDSIAEEYGTLGWLQAQQDKHERHRDGYAEMLRQRQAASQEQESEEPSEPQELTEDDKRRIEEEYRSHGLI